MLIIGHRGAPSILQENTLDSFRLALDKGVDGLEFDVQLTQDQELIVFHDFNILQSNGQKFPIEQLTTQDISTLDISFKIPTLKEVLAICPPGVLINIEIKLQTIFSKPIVFKILDLLYNHQLTSSVLVSSFNPFVLCEIKKQAPHLNTGLLWTQNPTRDWFITKYSYNFLKPYSFHANINYIDYQLAQWVHEKNMKLFLYTINTPTDRDKALQLDAYAIFSDYPDIMEL